MPHQMAAARHLHSAPWWAARQTSPSARGWWPTPVARGWWPTPVAAALHTRSSARRSPPRSGGNCASWPHHRRRPCGKAAAPVGVSSSARHRNHESVGLGRQEAGRAEVPPGVPEGREDRHRRGGTPRRPKATETASAPDGGGLTATSAHGGAPIRILSRRSGSRAAADGGQGPAIYCCS